MGKVNSEPVPKILGRSVRGIQHQPHSERDECQCPPASPDHQEEELDVSLQCRGWYVVTYKRDYMECLAEEEENVSGHRSISLDRKQDCDWSIDSIE